MGAAVLWVLLTLVGLGLCLVGWMRVPLPDWLPYAGAVLVTGVYATALAQRAGAPALPSGLVMAAAGVVALVSQHPVLLSGVAVATAGGAAVLSVLLTRPAASLLGVARELVVALAIGVVAAFAVEAYQAPLSVDRGSYLAMGIALLVGFSFAWRLGLGSSGLGPGGATAVGIGVLLLFVGLAYTEALSRWGAVDLVERIGDVFDRVREQIGALPRPTVTLFGVPGLMWGVRLRARSRVGWWVCAFAAAGLAVVATGLLDPALALSEAGESLGYSVLIGVVLGAVLLRLDAYVTRHGGRRARSAEEESIHLPEPRRTEPLL